MGSWVLEQDNGACWVPTLPQCQEQWWPGPSFPGGPLSLGTGTWGWLWPPASVMFLFRRGPQGPGTHPRATQTVWPHKGHQPDGLQVWQAPLSTAVTWGLFWLEAPSRWLCAPPRTKNRTCHLGSCAAPFQSLTVTHFQ